jgi:hypothetical protein
MDAATVRLAIQTRNKEIEQLMARTPVDSLAVEELLSANQRDVRALRQHTAQNIVNAAPRREQKPEMANFMARFFPQAQSLFTPGAFRATR